MAPGLAEPDRVVAQFIGQTCRAHRLAPVAAGCNSTSNSQFHCVCRLSNTSTLLARIRWIVASVSGGDCARIHDVPTARSIVYHWPLAGMQSYSSLGLAQEGPRCLGLQPISKLILQLSRHACSKRARASGLSPLPSARTRSPRACATSSPRSSASLNGQGTPHLLRTVGSGGWAWADPSVEIQSPDGPAVLYGNITPERAK